MADRDFERRLDRLEVDIAKAESRPSAPIGENVQPSAIMSELVAKLLWSLRGCDSAPIDCVPNETEAYTRQAYDYVQRMKCG